MSVIVGPAITQANRRRHKEKDTDMKGPVKDDANPEDHNEANSDAEDLP
jgi:hypothetical protein